MISENVPETSLFCFYLSSTHWDREWYLPFQYFRAHLNDTIKEVLDTLEQSADFNAFLLDGQTVLLEDHIETCPEDLPRIKRLLSQERLWAGPWYTMPDENLVSGESLIRNLQMGHQSALEFGAAKPLPIGYMCDCFGHIAQMPQILNGFGINTALLGRGTNNSIFPAFFIWQSPNKSQCITYKVPEECGYGTFWYDVFADGCTNLSELTKRALKHIENEQMRTKVPIVILTDAMDHTRMHKEAPAICSEIENHLTCKTSLGNASLLVDTLSRYKDLMPIKEGELQQPAQNMSEHNRLISGTLSSRYDMKKYNDIVQASIEKTSLPLAALALINGANFNFNYEKKAYKYLLKNHAHDSICGCSIDEVHQDMLYRFRQASRLSNIMRDSAICTLTPENQDESSQSLYVFNPHPWSHKNVINASVRLDDNFSTSWSEFIPSENVRQFIIKDSNGEVVPYQISKIHKKSNFHAPRGFYSQVLDRYDLQLYAQLPPMGFARFTLHASETPCRNFKSLKTAPLCAENEFLKISLNCNGQLTITDKRTNSIWHDVLAFTDSGDTGDGWSYRAPQPDCIVHSSYGYVETVEDGPVSCVFRIINKIDIPLKMEYSPHYTCRSAEHTSLIISTTVSLKQGSDTIDLNVEIDNNASDHQIKMLIKTNVHTDNYVAEQAFCFIERAIGRDVNTENWKEADRAEKSFEHIIYRRSKDDIGLAFISGGGLHEGAALTGEDGYLGITLMRCFSKTFLTDGESDGQLHGKLRFTAALMPLTPNTQICELLNKRDMLLAPPYDTMRKAIIPFHKGFEIASDLCGITVIRPCKDGKILIRIVNYSHSTAVANIKSPWRIKNVYKSDLNEQNQKTITHAIYDITLYLDPCEIFTLLVQV